MKTIVIHFRAVLLPLSLLVFPIAVQAQDFNYTISEGAVTITGYAGEGGEAVFPSTIEELPVRTIGEPAFARETSITTRVTIPVNVTGIGATRSLAAPVSARLPWSHVSEQQI